MLLKKCSYDRVIQLKNIIMDFGAAPQLKTAFNENILAWFGLVGLHLSISGNKVEHDKKCYWPCHERDRLHVMQGLQGNTS